MIEKRFDEAYFRVSSDYIKSKVSSTPETAIILGSCLGNIADQIENKVVIKYEEIPNFLISTVQSHAGELIFGTLSGKDIVCMSGRFHFYEGYDFEELVTPVRVFHLLGIKNLILTNAAGGINENFSVGDIMLITDHIKLYGASPLRGPNVEFFGDRFFDVSDMYTKTLQAVARKSAENVGIVLKTGVYFFAPGPQFESPSEIKVFRKLGGDAVGMSTVTETLTACHCGMKVMGLSLISNMAAGMTGEALTTDEVDDAANMAADKFQRLIKEIVSLI